MNTRQMMDSQADYSQGFIGLSAPGPQITKNFPKMAYFSPKMA